MSNIFDDLMMSIYAPGEQDRSALLTQQGIDLELKRQAMGRQSMQTTQDRINKITNADAEALRLFSPSEGFKEGWLQGWEDEKAAVRDTVGDSIKFSLKTLWDLLPWWVWALLGVGALVYFTPLITAFFGIFSGKK